MVNPVVKAAGIICYLLLSFKISCKTVDLSQPLYNPWLKKQHVCVGRGSIPYFICTAGSHPATTSARLCSNAVSMLVAAKKVAYTATLIDERTFRLAMVLSRRFDKPVWLPPKLKRLVRSSPILMMHNAAGRLYSDNAAGRL